MKHFQKLSTRHSFMFISYKEFDGVMTVHPSRHSLSFLKVGLVYWLTIEKYNVMDAVKCSYNARVGCNHFYTEIPYRDQICRQNGDIHCQKILWLSVKDVCIFYIHSDFVYIIVLTFVGYR